MNIPQSFELYGFTVTSISLFVVLGFVIYAFFLWRLGKKEGFDEEKLFDLFVLSSLGTVLLFKVNILLVAGIIFLIVLTLSQMWRWSPFRILDIFLLSFYSGILATLFGYILIYKGYMYFPVIMAGGISVFLFSKIRISMIKSGYTFSLLLLLTAILLYAYFKDKNYLIFYVFLIIISFANIYLRERKSMIKPSLPINFLNKVKNQLLHKRKRLKAEQKILMQEDPYMQSGRTDANAETIDEAILEDTHKEWNDLRKLSLEKMQIQVRKALARIRLGSYGICEVCGKPIDKARLKAYPEATTCFEHAPNA